MNAPTQSEASVYQIRAGVAKVRRPDGCVLVAPTDNRSLRVSPVADELLPLLVRGASFGQLVTELRRTHPLVVDIVPKLSAFLDQLGRAGLLDARPAADRRRAVPRLILLQPDRGVAAIASRFQKISPRALWVIWSVALLAAAIGIITLVASNRAPHPRVLFTNFDFTGLLLFVFVVVPLHEFGHAIACRLAGQPVGGAGIIFHGRVIPGPFVDTSSMYRIRDRWTRFWIPAAGPCVDLIFAGAAAWGLVVVEPTNVPLTDALSILFIICVAFLYFDTNPLVASDGSRMLEAMFEDELARVSALSRTRSRLSHWRTVARYRVVTTLHAQGALAIAWMWWT